MREGGTLMIHSTVSPDLVLAVARGGAGRGIQVIDAPVTVTRYGPSRSSTTPGSWPGAAA
jgi:3-hydroxyisobutyrate dehydrogenase-like beta-hydroxyacid dehydrogenase